MNLQDIYFGNSLYEYVMAAGIFAVLFLVFAIFQKIVLYRLKKLASRTRNDIDDEVIKIVQSVKPPFYSFLALYLGIRILAVHQLILKSIEIILIIWFVYQLINAVQILINFTVRKKFSEETGQSKTAANVLGVLVKFVLWVVALLMILANLGVNITSLVAALGIGGLAIAMALKNILGDLFASFAIYFDKPFLVGDTIVFGDKEGKVERIGIKTTRVRSLSGEEVIIPNDKLISSVVVKK